ncbi:lysophospholipase L1-like esterase [Sphingomonas sp. F9_3S_D5_B_2]
MAGEPCHVVLFGDSIFDNGAYVRGGPDVVAQLRQVLPRGSEATLLAVDGAVTSDVPRQLARLPNNANLLVVSAGGNDALGDAHLLRQPATSIGEAVAVLGRAQGSFARRYQAMADAVTALGVPAAICTIYDANFPPPEGPVIRTALSLFNDVITRVAFSAGLPLIDLRLLCNEPADYANPIEPSVQGGAKIAAAIAALASGTTPAKSSMVIAST